jgi:leucyl aminopeptidase
MNLSMGKDWKKSAFDGFLVPMFEEELAVEGLEIPFEQLVKTKRFEGKVGSRYTITKLQDGLFVNIVLLGLGKRGEIGYRKLLSVLGDGYRTLKKQKVKKGALVFDSGNLASNDTYVKAAVESSIMADYLFDDFKSKEEDEESEELGFSIVVEDPDQYVHVFEEAEILATANLVARDLVNQPANVINSVTLAQRVEELGKENGFEVEIKELEEIQALQMEAFLSVARASDIEPRLIIMRYMGDPGSDEILGYVGKGLTYDAGGLSIKPTASMVTMKDDMGGSAAVIGAMCAIAEAKLKRNVVAVVAACENMISGSSYRPGDIIGSMGGKSIYIGNTDAEGRLTLIDAMHYIVTEEKVTKVLDIATLTGAALHCTGSVASVAIGTDDQFFADVNEAFSLSGEQIWRMPIFDEYKELIKHEEADLTNTAGKPGTITAGLFIGEFNGGLPWVHIDIAGTIWSTKEEGILSKGGTGIAVRPLYYLAKA